MTLRLITGAANAGKTGVIYSVMREALCAGRRPVLVVPSRPDAERALAELSREFPVGVRVVTFARFIALVWDQYGDGREIATDAQRRLLCLSAAQSAGASSGIALLAAECVGRLAESTGGAWRTATPCGVPPEGMRLTKTLSAYAAILEDRGLVEPAEAAWLLPDRAGHAEVPLLVHRFADFTPAQTNLIRRWAEKGDVWVSLTWREGLAPTAASSELIDRLGPAEMLPVPEEPCGRDDLVELGESLFGNPADLSAGDAVRFSLAEGHAAEAQRMADEVKLALLEGTANSPEEIAVVFGDVEAHYPALRQAFAEASIEADFDVRVSFGQTPFGSAVNHAIGFALEGDRSSVLALLRSPFSGSDCEGARWLERRWRRQALTDVSRMLSDVRKLSPRLEKALREWRGAAGGPVDAGIAATLAKATRALFAIGYGEAGALGTDRAMRDAWAHQVVLSTLSDVSRLVPGAVSLADVREALRLQRVRPRESERPGHVQVMPLSRIRGRRFETVVIGGLNTGEIPGLPEEDSLPGSTVEVVLKAFGGAGEVPKGVEYEQLVFYLAATRPRKRLILSAQSTDADGEPRQVSPFYEVVCDSFRRAYEDAAWPPHEFRSAAQAPSSDADPGSREAERSLAYAGGTGTVRSAAARRRGAPRQPGLHDPGLLDVLGERSVFSASEIETYLNCPYSWFYSRAVRPEELEREAGAAEQGTFAHRLLEGVYRRLRERGIERVTNATRAVALEELDRVFAAEIHASTRAASVGEKIEQEAARRWAERIIGDDATRFAGFRPEYLEWEFGSDGDPIALGSFAIRGRVDRIDVDCDGRAIVMDYKRSVATTAAEILGRGKVQMPLYLTVVERELGLSPVAGLYRCLRERKDRGLVVRDALPEDRFTRTDLLSGADFKTLVEAGVELAETAVAGIRAGRIDCEPLHASSCSHCKATLSCGGAQ